MAQKQRYTAEEALYIIQNDCMIESESDTVDSDALEDVLQEIERSNEQIDEQLLADVANKIAPTEEVADNAAVDFQMVSGADNEINENINNTQSKSKKRKPEEWKQNIAKRQRSLGQEYLGKKLVNGEWVSAVKPERKMGKLCSKETCRKSTKRFCNEFSEDCQKVFNEYWRTGDNRMQDTFILSNVDVVSKKQGDQENTKRQNTRKFHLKKNGLSLEVCKEMFLNTLSISGQKLHTVLQTDKENIGIAKETVKSRNPKPSKGFKWNESDQVFLKEFFDKIPKAPGHYCRKDSNKIYLSSIVPSMVKLHHVYKARCRAFNKSPFGMTKFREYFTEHNYSLFQRKKDKCNTCVAFDEGNVSEAEFQAHQKLKNDALDLKEKDKSSADNQSTIVITADTESLLLAPSNDANVMFFHSKLNVHNFTFYNVCDREVLNYVWSEINGNLDSSIFASCYVDYLSKVIEAHPEVMTIIIWTDGCSYQNRCSVLSSVLLTFAVEYNITIYHKYLVVGHTHMECDSVHAAVETALKHTKVNLPSDYINIIESARKSKPGRYRAKYLDYSFFKDYKSISDIKSIKPSKDVGPPRVIDIRQLRYDPEGKLSVNLTYSDDGWEKLPYNIALTHQNPPQLFDAPIKITFAKYSDLQEIKQTIPKECHYFYDNIEHHAKPVKDKKK